jgi:PAS domain S-box-containing protein
MTPAKKQPKKTTATNDKKKSVQRFLKKSGNGSGDLQKFVELLQINQIELEHQNEELRITEEELEASRNKYVNLFDFSPIPYFALDPDGTIKKVNLNGAKMFGVDRSKLIEKSFLQYIPNDEKNIFTSFIKTVFTTSEKQSCKLKVVSKEKKVLYVLMEGVKLDYVLEAEQRCQIALIDLTEYKKLEDSFNQLADELKLLKAAKK